MSKMRFLVLGLLLLLMAPVQVSASEDLLLEFDEMIPVSGEFVGPANPVRGLGGGGLPWIITAGRGQLNSDGDLTVDVTGLVLARMAPVPANLQGTNPINPFQVIVSCEDEEGNPVNLIAGTTPATRTGDAHLETHVNLPDPCNDPIVFVTTVTTSTMPARWLAASDVD